MPGPGDSARGARSEGTFGVFVDVADQETVPGEGGEVQPEGGVELQAPDMQAVGQAQCRRLSQVGQYGSFLPSSVFWIGARVCLIRACSKPR